MSKQKVIFLGALPPPYIGPTLATQVILSSSLADNYELIHLDTSDHRSASSLGAFDLTNIFLGIRHVLELIGLLLRHRDAVAVYIPVSQTTVGYLRDSLFILLGRLFGRKVICHLRGGNFRNWLNAATRLTNAYVRFVHARVDGQIVLGDNLRYLFAGLVPDRSIHVVPNGKDIDFDFTPVADRKEIVVLYLANYIRTKGMFDIIRAIPEINRQSDDHHITFRFVGEWRDQQLKHEVESFIAEHQLTNVDIQGRKVGDEKFQQFNEADIFVFPTYYPAEGHPWVIVEALAAGLPVISTDHGAIAESVIDDQNGYLVGKQSPGEIAAKVLQIAQDDDLRTRLSKGSRKMYEEHFTEEKMVARLRASFDATLAD